MCLIGNVDFVGDLDGFIGGAVYRQGRVLGLAFGVCAEADFVAVLVYAVNVAVF